MSAGSNYGLLYALAKGSGGHLWRRTLRRFDHPHGFPVAIGVAAIMAVVAGLLIIPLKTNPPIWQGDKIPSGAPAE